MESIWEKTCRGPARPPLYGKAQADVAVIGGGMTGILTALELQERGLQVVVAEAGHVGGGQTGRTTAKLTAQHGAIYAGLIERLGREKAAMYARANRRAVERCCARIELEQIDCDLERTDSWLYSYDREDSLLREAEAERALGLDASFEPDTPLPLRVCGGVRLRGQAQFHPLKFLQALADRLTIYERTPVEHVEGGTLFTPRGTIEAGRVVFASHYPFVNVPGLYFARMHQERSYAIALENAVLPAGMYYGLEPNAWSLRSYRGTVILGGGAHRRPIAGKICQSRLLRPFRARAHIEEIRAGEVGLLPRKNCLHRPERRRALRRPARGGAGAVPRQPRGGALVGAGLHDGLRRAVYRAVLRKGPAVVCGDGLPQMGHVECHGRGGAADGPDLRRQSPGCRGL